MGRSSRLGCLHGNLMPGFGSRRGLALLWEAEGQKAQLVTLPSRLLYKVGFEDGVLRPGNQQKATQISLGEPVRANSML